MKTNKTIKLTTREALDMLIISGVKQISVHPGTEPRGHTEFECRFCGARSTAGDASKIQHIGNCAMGLVQKSEIE